MLVYTYTYTHMSELCDSASILVVINTITVLSTRARVVSTIKIKSVYPLQPFQRYFYVVCLHTIQGRRNRWGWWGFGPTTFGVIIN